jgi:hypothetical protein
MMNQTMTMINYRKLERTATMDMWRVWGSITLPPGINPDDQYGGEPGGRAIWQMTVATEIDGREELEVLEAVNLNGDEVQQAVEMWLGHL